MSQVSQVSQVFNASVFVSAELDRLMISASKEFATRVVEFCASQYEFNAEEAIRMLGLETVTLKKDAAVAIVAEKKSKCVAASKPCIPLPYNGEMNKELCNALRQNNGLYTQCQVSRKGENAYCKSCQALADKSDDGVPEYGTIQQRNAVSVLEYVDPKGRKPVLYGKLMNKYKMSQEQVIEEAGKFDIIINESHFVISGEAKKGRPSKEKVAKEPVGAKGRPKKTKKVVTIAEDEDDLFASLVAQVNDEEENDEEAELQEEIVNLENAKACLVQKVADEEEAAKKVADEATAAAKVAKKVADEEAKVAAKVAKKVADADAKAAKKVADADAKAAKKVAEADAKAAKDAKKVADEEAKVAKKVAEAEAKAAKDAKKVVAEKAAVKEAKEEEEEEEEEEDEDEDDEKEDTVKKINFEGKPYLKSQNTGVIYDYDEFIKNESQIVVGVWNETTKKIDFKKSNSNAESDEETEDEYEEE